MERGMRDEGRGFIGEGGLSVAMGVHYKAVARKLMSHTCILLPTYNYSLVCFL